MKKIMLGIIIVLTMVLVLGISWGKLFKRGYTQDEYGAELEKRDKRIEELEDSIRIMNAKVEFFDEGIKWLRGASDEELERSIKLLRSVPYDELLP
jgi:hypothetical protein